MILQTVSISAAPRELHIKLFKAHGDELEKLEEEIASLDAVTLVSWARVFEAVKAPGVVATGKYSTKLTARHTQSNAYCTHL